ncbi:uncharacterized protein LOC118001450 [Mirounga leonina]|uniref:uncharacterized protein LOC118001450 n=1 Tax=Mirounga leonina TaxID=9715 RepID=UPI00156BF3B3|nr:uncharacterized protein LOC118001450 [Mirounga leonina]
MMESSVTVASPQDVLVVCTPVESGSSSICQEASEVVLTPYVLSLCTKCVNWIEHQTAHYRDKYAPFPKLDDRTSPVHLPSLPCRPCVEENEIPSEVYNVIDSEEGLRDPLVFNDPYWPMQWELIECTLTPPAEDVSKATFRASEVSAEGKISTRRKHQATSTLLTRTPNTGTAKWEEGAVTTRRRAEGLKSSRNDFTTAAPYS